MLRQIAVDVPRTAPGARGVYVHWEAAPALASVARRPQLPLTRVCAAPWRCACACRARSSCSLPARCHSARCCAGVAFVREPCVQQALERVLFIRATRAAASSYVQARAGSFCSHRRSGFAPAARLGASCSAHCCMCMCMPAGVDRVPFSFFIPQGMNDLVIPFLVVFFGEAADGATDIVRAPLTYLDCDCEAPSARRGCPSGGCLALLLTDHAMTTPARKPHLFAIRPTHRTRSAQRYPRGWTASAWRTRRRTATGACASCWTRSRRTTRSRSRGSRRRRADSRGYPRLDRLRVRVTAYGKRKRKPCASVGRASSCVV